MRTIEIIRSNWCRPNGLLVAAVFLLALGGIGGSWQPSRLVLLAGALPALFALAARPRPRCTVERSAWLCAITLVSLGALSLSWSDYPIEGISLWLVVATGLTALAYVRATPLTLQSARHIRDAWTSALVVTLPVALYELLTGNHFIYALEDRDIGGGFGALPFASVFFGNYNNYCVFICLALPMLFGSIECARSVGLRLLLTASAALSYAILVVNTSRLALAFAAWLMIYYAITRPAWRLWLAIALIAAFSAILVADFGTDLENIIAVATLKFENVNESDNSTSERIDLILAGINAVTETYGLGLGIGAFEPYLRSVHPNLIPNAHNLFIELATNFGLVPTMAFAILLVHIFAAVQKRRLPNDLSAAVTTSIPFVPALGAINSQAVGYTYWWLWMATMVFFAAIAQQQEKFQASRSDTVFRDGDQG